MENPEETSAEDYQLSEEQCVEAVADLSNVLDMARWAMTQFNMANLYFGHGTDNAWDEALSLIAQVLHLPQPLHEEFFNAKLTTSERTTVVALIDERIEKRIPLAYLTNQAWFAGLPFYVDERVLVPRSPFSELLENRFSSWYESAPAHVLDMCTGSGCIAIAASYVFPEATADAVDISTDALAVADININEHQVADRVFPIQSDLFSNLTGQVYDLIICNPPYVDAEDMSDLPSEFHHEPELGLAAGNLGMDLVDTILKTAAQHLSHNGWLFVEVGNSLVHMPDLYPDLPLHWVNLANGGVGVFAINKEELEAWNSGEKSE